MTVISSLTRAAVINRRRWIIDPERGLDIVTLGLIYGVTVRDGTVHVAMTLTTRGCPLHDAVADATRSTGWTAWSVSNSHSSGSRRGTPR